MTTVLYAHCVAIFINVFTFPGFLTPFQFLRAWSVPYFIPLFGFQDFVRPIRGYLSVQLLVATVRDLHHVTLPGVISGSSWGGRCLCGLRLGRYLHSIGYVFLW